VLELPVADAIAVEHNPLGRPAVPIVKGLQEVSAEKDEGQVGTSPNISSVASCLMSDGVEQVRHLSSIHSLFICLLIFTFYVVFIYRLLSTEQGSFHERHPAGFCTVRRGERHEHTGTQMLTYVRNAQAHKRPVFLAVCRNGSSHKLRFLVHSSSQRKTASNPSELSPGRSSGSFHTRQFNEGLAFSRRSCPQNYLSQCRHNWRLQMRPLLGLLQRIRADLDNYADVTGYPN
jgi:hypothetical protein